MLLDILLNDSVKFTENIIIKSDSIYSIEFNFWIIISCLELLIILFLLLRIKKSKKNAIPKTQKQQIISENVDFENIFNSAFHANELYDRLKIKCHPDRFPIDSELNIKANEIFQEITKNKNNYKELKRLQQKAINELDIKL